eukprot:8203-Heterococcus_DN1.PRE.2
MVRIPASGADEPLLKAMTEKANYMSTLDDSVDPVVEAEEGGRSDQLLQQQHHRSRSRSPRDRDNGRRTRFDSVDDGTSHVAISSSLTADHSSHFDAHKGYRSEGGGSPDPSRRH